MGIQDRDYMSRPERGDYPARPRSPALGSLVWSLLAIVGFFYLVSEGHSWWARNRVEAMRAAPPSNGPPQRPPGVANPDPFPNDPTWHTRPRPTAEAPAGPVSPSPQAVYRCVVDGVVSYSGSGNCRGAPATTVPIDPGPDAATIAKAQAEARASIERANAQVASLRQQARANESARTVYTEQVQAGNVSSRAECPHLDRAIKQLDDLARTPLSGAQQDQIRADRQRLRDRQAMLRC